MPDSLVGLTGTALEVEASGAGRGVLRPESYGSLGAYNKLITSGTMAAGLGAAAEVFGFRWTDATEPCLIRRVRLTAGDLVGFTAGIATFGLFMARDFTASMTGGNAGTLTGNNGKLRTNMGTMQPADIRISSTVALGAGTKTLDTDAIGGGTFSVITTAGAAMGPLPDLFYAPPGAQPIVLTQDEGIVIRATVPATGTWTFSVQVDWQELPSY